MSFKMIKKHNRQVKFVNEVVPVVTAVIPAGSATLQGFPAFETKIPANRHSGN